MTKFKVGDMIMVDPDYKENTHPWQVDALSRYINDGIIKLNKSYKVLEINDYTVAVHGEQDHLRFGLYFSEIVNCAIYEKQQKFREQLEEIINE